jgi:hypothetical protein
LAAGAAPSAKRGETRLSELQDAAREMYHSTTEEHLEDFASTDREGKPEHTSKS